ncbi:PH domain-containing protein [Virgibacillus sp. Bac332]|uniref:PH domain-containing protein n=1 Tax=Virgibacillus sp. Bac332 TaxID=2419842 RepID=UPI000EF45F11|nr:PH domain-containing protein [Virgibacillus sp. Bac332]
MTIILVSAILIIVFISIPFISSFNSLNVLSVLLWAFLLITTVGVLLWTSYDIKYTFYDDFLYLRGGIFRSRIHFDKISKVESFQFKTLDLLAGYRILTSKDGIEITYNKRFGAVKISPNPNPYFYPN